VVSRVWHVQGAGVLLKLLGLPGQEIARPLRPDEEDDGKGWFAATGTVIANPLGLA